MKFGGPSCPTFPYDLLKHMRHCLAMQQTCYDVADCNVLKELDHARIMHDTYVVQMGEEWEHAQLIEQPDVATAEETAGFVRQMEKRQQTEEQAVEVEPLPPPLQEVM